MPASAALATAGHRSLRRSVGSGPSPGSTDCNVRYRRDPGTTDS